MNKKISLGAAISFMAIAAAITFILTMTFAQDIFNTKVQNVKEREEMYTKLGALDTRVRGSYDGTIDEQKLLDDIAAGYVAGLGDKYARYYSAEDYAVEQRATDGYSVGVGVNVVKEESGYIKVMSVVEGSPAQQAGIVTGDIIVKVDGNDVLVDGYDKAVKNVRGNEGTRVKLTLRRDGQDVDFEMERKKMDIVSVTGKMIGNLGYVKLTEFNNTTFTQFQGVLDGLVAQQAKGIIFDVRNNGGGTLDGVLKVLDYILPKGTLATSVDKDGKTEVLGTSDDEHQLALPVTVLTNARTASAAELFSATIRDFGKGKLVGVKTYGKGVMQNTYTLDDGSAVTFTTAHYNAPKTENYDGVGLQPDFEVTLSQELENAIDTLDENTDAQLKKAIEVITTTINEQ